MNSHGHRASALRRVTLYVPLTLFVVFIVFPFYWTLNTSLKTPETVLHLPVRYLPDPITFDNYLRTWNRMGFEGFFINSLMIAAMTMLFTIVVTTLAGYGISRFRFRGRGLLLVVFLATQMFPGALLLIPLFRIFKALSLINSIWSLVLVYTTVSIPFCTLLMRGFIATVPVEIEDAAMIDGCSRLGVLRRVILPIVAPGIVTAGIFAFINSWNELVLATMFINDRSKMTIPVGLNFFLGEYTIDWGAITAGGVMALIPVILLFAYVQRYLVTGLSEGAVKG